jgi:hypothetical protein
MSTYSETKKRYYEKHKEKLNALHKVWLFKNKEHIKDYRRKYMEGYRAKEHEIPDDGWKFVGKSNSNIKGI